MKRLRQSVTTCPEQPQGNAHVAGECGDPASPYLLTDEAARFLRFPSAHLFRKWAGRNRVPVQRRGRTLLYERRVLVAFLNGEAWTVRHSAQSVSRPRLIRQSNSIAPRSAR